MLRKIRLFYPSFSCIWIIYYHSEKCHDCSSLRLVPRLGSDDRGHVGIPKRTKQVTSSPPSYQYEVDLGFPIAAFSASDTEDEAKLEKEKQHLRDCIDFDLRNLVFSEHTFPISSGLQKPIVTRTGRSLRSTTTKLPWILSIRSKFTHSLVQHSFPKLFATEPTVNRTFSVHFERSTRKDQMAQSHQRLRQLSQRFFESKS